MRHTALAASLTLLAATTHAGDLAITIYSKAQPGAVSAELYRPGASSGHRNIPGYAIVRDTRALDIPAGTSEIRISDVAGLIDPTTVQFRALAADGNTRVLEQDFQFDLVSTQQLLNRYIDQPIDVEQIIGDGLRTIGGTLLSTDGGLVLATDNGVEVVREHSRLRFPELPGGLISKPTLVWQVHSDTAGGQAAEISYETGGITWWADYNLLLDEGRQQEQCRLDVSAWVSIVNRSGAGYPDAKLKLVAGDVQRAQAQPKFEAAAVAYDAVRSAPPAGFAEKAFFEYHLYTLQRPTTLANNATKQIELFPAAGDVQCQRIYRLGNLNNALHYYRPTLDQQAYFGGEDKVSVSLRFDNKEGNHLGIPLPAGRIRVSKRDSDDGAIEFIGEDLIDHTPKNETLDIRLGSAFDISAERKQTHFALNKRNQTIDEKFSITLRNHKASAVTVDVVEALSRWSRWHITHKSHDYRQHDHGRVIFPVTVPADGQAVLEYSVRYEW